MVMDVDGTLTDGKIYMGQEGEIFKAFNVRDGYAIHELLPKYNIIPVIITGRISRIVENRAKEIGITHIFQGIDDKLEQLRKLVQEKNISLANVAYIGDDINDLECMKTCGLKGCPADAAPEIKNIADFISKKNGGEGAVREFIENIIKIIQREK
jgi:3-deoxy-D-manno-octulosonate 8-phosphate phosphatase (KDO 8-P phosphatase)